MPSLVSSGHEVQQRCLAMLVFITSLWVTEALPYFATSLLVPVLVVFLKVLNNKTNPEILLDASKYCSKCHILFCAIS